MAPSVRCQIKELYENVVVKSEMLQYILFSYLKKIIPTQLLTNQSAVKVKSLKATLKIGGGFAMAVHTSQSKLLRDLIFLIPSIFIMRQILKIFESAL